MSGPLRDWCGDDAAVPVLFEQARAFVLAGGAWSSDDWARMTSEERAVAVTAGDHLRRESAVMVGNASRGTLEAAEVFAPVDGGDELECEILGGMRR